MEGEDLDRRIAEAFFGWTARCPGPDYAARPLEHRTDVEGKTGRYAYSCPACGRVVPIDPEAFTYLGVVPVYVIPEHERWLPPYSSDIRFAALVLVALYEQGAAMSLDIRPPTDGGVRVRVERTGRPEPSNIGVEVARAVCRAALPSVEAHRPEGAVPQPEY